MLFRSFIVQPANIDESRHPHEAPRTYVQRIARQKAEAISSPLPVLAADTIVFFGSTVFGKPADPAEARQMLRALSGRSHQVCTSVCLRLSDRVIQKTIRSEVVFRVLSEADISRYLSTGEAFDKAGSYGIQGEGMGLVERVRGSYTNVVGLPLSETLDLLSKIGRAHV